MSETSERLERFVAECCGGQPVADRLSELDDLGERAAPPAGDLAALSALGNETRLGLVRALVAADRDLCVCELHPLFEVGESAVSHALAELREADLVERREEGRWHYYEPTARAERLVAVLDDTRRAEASESRQEATVTDGDGA